MNELERQQQGFLETPLLFKGHSILEVASFDELPAQPMDTTIKIPKKLRLGQRVEYFFEAGITASPYFKLLAKNIQIKQQKITLGELDFLLKDLRNNQLLHIELVCKFYIYLPDQSKNDLECWIGPNKKDSLVEKVKKLKERQLLLLFHKASEEWLQGSQLASKNIEQQVCFKAQLFVPLSMLESSFKYINEDCIVGYWVTYQQLQGQIDTKATYCIPKKHDWVAQPFETAEWNPFETFNKQLEQYMNEKRSPLCWKRDLMGKLSSFFVVWW